jgi:hypothetical protein
MTSPYRIERDRGTEEARQQLVVLREKWPLAFPVQHQDVRPLAMGVARQAAAAMGWSLPYTLGVLGRWKMAAVYCQAVLSHDQRIALDGTPAETVPPGQASASPPPVPRASQLSSRPCVPQVSPAAWLPGPSPRRLKPPGLGRLRQGKPPSVRAGRGHSDRMR